MMLNTLCSSRIFMLSTVLVTIVSLTSCKTAQQIEEQSKPALSISDVINESQEVSNGNSFLQEKMYEKAVKAYQKALLVDQNNYEARLGLAESYYHMDKRELARAEYEILVGVPVYRTSALQGKGLLEIKGGSPDTALALLAMSVEEDPTLWRSWNGIAQIYDSRKDWDKAEDAYRRALTYTDTPAIIYNNMGVSYMGQEKFENAAEAFDNALKEDPSLSIATTNYRLALVMLDRYDEAVIEHDVYEEAKALNNAGYMAMRRGDYQEAEKMFVQAIETNPGFYEAPYKNLQVLNYIRTHGAQ